MAVDPTALKTEIQTDPKGYGYAVRVTANDWEGLATLLNTARAGEPVRRKDIAPAEIFEVLDMADLPSLSGNPTATQLSAERKYLAWLSAIGNLRSIRLLNDDGSNTAALNNLQQIAPAGSGSRTRLMAIATRNGSRIETLFGVGEKVQGADCKAALGPVVT